MEIVNLSEEPLGKLYSWIPHGLQAERIVFLPDACPGKSPLPTGTAVLTRQQNWRKFAISDCGCGMRLLRSDLARDELTQELWDTVAGLLRENKGQLGDLGGGNHFLDALISEQWGTLHFLIHTGSRNESGIVDGMVDSPERFDQEFFRVVNWADQNRAAIQSTLEKVFGPLKLILDKSHNEFEKLGNGQVIIRKGAVKLQPGGLAVIPSHMTGDVLLVEANDKISETLSSMSHGTGRKFSRSEAKNKISHEDIEKIKQTIMLPKDFNMDSLRTEGPQAYRALDDCLLLINDYVSIVERFKVIAYMGHL